MDQWQLGAKVEQASMANMAPRQMTPRDRLQQKKSHLESELKHVNDALDALTAHPDIEKVFELVGLAL